MNANKSINRVAVYLLGLMILTLGTTLCTKANLGIAPGVCVGFALSNAFGWSFPHTLFVVNVCLVGIQFLIRGRNCQMRDLLQIPFTLGFSAFLGWFGTLLDLSAESVLQRASILAAAIVLIGIGVSMSVKMNIAPNPPDGMVHTISVVAKKDMGMIKNICDITHVMLGAGIDLLFTGRVSSVGLGTVCCMIFIGRVVALFDRLFKEKLLTVTGLAQGGSPSADQDRVRATVVRKP